LAHAWAAACEATSNLNTDAVSWYKQNTVKKYFFAAHNMVIYFYMCSKLIKVSFVYHTEAENKM